MSDERATVSWKDRWTDGGAIAVPKQTAPGTFGGPPVDEGMFSGHQSKGPPLAWPSKNSKSPVAPAVPPSVGRGGAEAEAVGGDPSTPPAAEASPEATAEAADAPAHSPQDVGALYARFSDATRPLADRFKAEVPGAPAELLTHAIGFVFDVARGAVKLDQVKREHSYSFPMDELRTPRARAEATAFLNAMAANGMSEQDVLRTIGWWRGGGAKVMLDLAKAPRATNADETRPQSPAAELAAIERTMRDNRRAYNRDPAMQARYRQLLAARGGA